MYPYPSHVNVSSFVTIKLSDRDMYGMWKTQMKCLLTSHDMFGFIDGTFEDPRRSMSSLGKEKEEDYALWVRSDSLVKGWIFGSLSIHAFRLLTKNINEDFSAKDAWDKLHKMYGPDPLHINRQEVDESAIIFGFTVDNDVDWVNKTEMGLERRILESDKHIEGTERRKKEEELYKAIINQNPQKVHSIVSDIKEVKITDKITVNGNTALHLAVSVTNNTDILSRMLEGLTDETELFVKNSEGSTPLHVAAIVGNTKAAKLLVAKNKHVLLATDNEDQIPLARALSNMHSDTYLYLMDQTKALNKKEVVTEVVFISAGAHVLVVNAISSKDFVSARNLFDTFTPTDMDAILMALAQNFPSELNIWERMAYTISYFSTDMCCKAVYMRIEELDFNFRGFHDRKNPLMYPLFAKVWPLKLLLMKVEQYFRAVNFLVKLCVSMRRSADPNNYHYIKNLIFEATRQNAVQVVQIVMTLFPNAIWFVNEDGHNIIQFSILNRSEKVYNLVYQMSEQKNIYKTIKDSSGNNPLHLAARLAPPNKLSLISGEALQIQRELQWFQEVKKFVCPLNVLQKNSFEETPEMVFTREHKELVIEGEKWMKDTAASYTITAALITTIMFAAAITVPGGNNQDSGIPTFINKSAFTVFAVCVAISLLSSVTSLIMFLSILTARFAEQDFLLRLPTKLIIGLAALFVSTATMIIAFGVTMFLVFGKSDSSLLVHIAIWSCLPIACFVKFHFPLILDLISATYGLSIFGKKSDQPFY